MKKIGWVLIGASNIAREWMIDAIRQQDGEVVAVVSSNPERGIRFAEEHGIPASFTDINAALNLPNVNAAYISTTNELHLSQTLAAANAGKHVLCEKPLALNIDDARAMVSACRDAGVVMGTNHHLRNAATICKIRDLIRSGAIGTPLFARVFHAVYLPPNLQSWRINKPDAGGGVILDITVHDADTLRFILDAEPVRVAAQAVTGQMGSEGLEDGVMATIQFSNGVLAQVHDAFNIPYAGTGIEVHGSSGSIIAKDVMTQRPVGEIYIRNDQGMLAVSVEHENLYARSVKSFHTAILGEGMPAASGEDGVRSLATALAILNACRSGTQSIVTY